jgi:uncharacterized protein (DUF488 family)
MRFVTTVYTVGHSDHEAGEFVALLRQHGIEMLVDVRSSPYSRYFAQFILKTSQRDQCENRARIH